MLYAIKICTSITLPLKCEILCANLWWSKIHNTTHTTIYHVSSPTVLANTFFPSLKILWCQYYSPASLIISLFGFYAVCGVFSIVLQVNCELFLFSSASVYLLYIFGTYTSGQVLFSTIGLRAMHFFVSEDLTFWIDHFLTLHLYDFHHLEWWE